MWVLKVKLCFSTFDINVSLLHYLKLLQLLVLFGNELTIIRLNNPQIKTLYAYIVDDI